MPAETPIPETFLTAQEAPPPPDPMLGRLRVFSYTVEPLAPAYRAIMRLFAEAKARYQIQLRPEEVRTELDRLAPPLALPEGGLERALEKLVEWGNLRRTHDTGRVATLADFRRKHFLYQITPAGEAVEKAIKSVVEALEKSGSLQTVMLGAIARNLAALATELDRKPPSPAVLFENLFNVTQQFTALTENAATFMARLHEAIEVGEVDLTAFTLYKQAVIAYLEDFIGQLAALAPQIEQRLRAFKPEQVELLAKLAAQADEAPVLGGTRDLAAELVEQWRGLTRWFVGDGREPPTVEHLRGAARGAINRILRVLEQLHEKRFRRVSRTADLLRLAAWFEAAPDESAAHRLFQDAFGLHGSRHLGGLDEERDLVRPAVSWWHGTPVQISPALRETGRVYSPGRAARIVDHEAARRRLAEAHRARHARFLRALERFAERGPQALAELGLLAPEEFELLLDCLDRLLSLPPNAAGEHHARSRDGRLELRLVPPPGDDRAIVATRAGRLELPAYVLTVVDRARRRVENRERVGVE